MFWVEHQAFADLIECEEHLGKDTLRYQRSNPAARAETYNAPHAAFALVNEEGS